MLTSKSQLWPYSSPVSGISLPTEFFAAFNTFHGGYSKKNPRKQLTLQPALGTAEINAIFYGPDKRVKKKQKRTANQSDNVTRNHMLKVSTYQMCVLMLFNDNPKLSYKASISFLKIQSFRLLISCFRRFLCQQKFLRRIWTLSWIRLCWVYDALVFLQINRRDRCVKNRFSLSTTNTSNPISSSKILVVAFVTYTIYLISSLYFKLVPSFRWPIWL